MKRVYVVNTVERVERRYLVEFFDEDIARLTGTPVGQIDEQDRRVYAEEIVVDGSMAKFTEGNADIDEVLEVKEQTS